MIKYDDNITIVKCKNVSLGSIEKDNQFFALMVTDNVESCRNTDRNVFDIEKGWLGLECTSRGVYICKSIKYPENSIGQYGEPRGIPVLVEVTDESKCIRLTNYE